MTAWGISGVSAFSAQMGRRGALFCISVLLEDGQGELVTKKSGESLGYKWAIGNTWSNENFKLPNHALPYFHSSVLLRGAGRGESVSVSKEVYFTQRSYLL